MAASVMVAPVVTVEFLVLVAMVVLVAPEMRARMMVAPAVAVEPLGWKVPAVLVVCLAARVVPQGPRAGAVRDFPATVAMVATVVPGSSRRQPE